ncbi:MAG: hypothetical protein PWQ37_2349 [Candidatus Petromonas sp.]|jgi:integrase|nr:hypothetical protein [Candidatus Petromonas sp.]
MRLDLDSFRIKLDELVNKKIISKTTADTYFSCLNTIQREVENIDPTSLKNFLISKLDDRRQFLKFISAIRSYEKYVLDQEKGILFGEPEIQLFNHFKKRDLSCGKEPRISESRALRKINALRNKKLKYALRLQIKSGLRISEIADLSKDDIEFKDGKIKVFVKSGKGDKSRKVSVVEDKYLYDRLLSYIKECDGDKLFYTADSLRGRAAEYGIQTHDLRRLNARKRLSIEMNKGRTREEAKRIIQKELGHESTKVTDLYITKRRRG